MRPQRCDRQRQRDTQVGRDAEKIPKRARDAETQGETERESGGRKAGGGRKDQRPHDSYKDGRQVGEGVDVWARVPEGPLEPWLSGSPGGPLPAHGAHFPDRCFPSKSCVSHEPPHVSCAGPPDASAVEGVTSASVEATPRPPVCSSWLSLQSCPPHTHT